MSSDGTASKVEEDKPSLFSRFRRKHTHAEPTQPQEQAVTHKGEGPARATPETPTVVSAKMSDSGNGGATTGVTSAGTKGGDGPHAISTEESGARRAEAAKTATTTTTRKVAVDTSALASSDENWRLAEETTEKARQQARLVEQATITTVETRNRLTQAERSVVESRRNLREIQGSLSGVDVESKRKEYDAALKDYNRQQAQIVTLSDDFNTRQANAERLKTQVQEKGAALQEEIASRDAALARAAELRAELERRQAALQEAEEAHRRRDGELASLKLKQDEIETEVLKAEKELKKSADEAEALQVRELELVGALERQRNQHAELSALLQDEEAAATFQANDWDAQKAELVPLTTEHAELVALYEADRAKLAELEEDAQDVVDDAKALEAELERRALELAKAEADVKAKEEAFHIYHDELVAAEEAADGLARAEKEQALAAEEADARVQELIAQLRASEECVDTAQALKEDYWKQAKFHGGEGDRISDRHFVRLSEAFPGGVDVKEMLEHSELTARIPNEGLDFEGPGTTRITSTETRSSSNEKWGREREGQTASSF